MLQESGAAVQQLNQPPASERVGNSVSEPLLTTGDALDKYQIVAEKVIINLSTFLLFSSKDFMCLLARDHDEIEI